MTDNTASREKNSPQFEMYSTTKDAWDGMFEALTAARVSILWEVYSFADDRAGHRFIELLKAKARLGVEVRMIVDHIGSRLLTAKTLDELRLSGVEVLVYNRVRFQLNIARSFVRLWQRNHRKVLIIDDETVFIGGVNVSFLATEWADLHVKLVGRELVAPLLYDFAATYRTLHNHPLVGRFGFVKKERVVVPWANGQISFVSLAPHWGSDRKFLRNFYLKALASARTKVTLITPYYVPYKRFLTELAKARKRGVEVEIITPVRSDHRFVDYMSYYYLELSERLGAKIFLLPYMNHAKGFLIDGAAGLIGSSNFTHRSFLANAESDVFFRNPAMVKRFEEIVETWKVSAASVGESGQKKHRIRAGFLNWIAQLFKEYV
jgi:cardiolipin synthase